jgi:hypothetical protein
MKDMEKYNIEGIFRDLTLALGVKVQTPATGLVREKRSRDD